ncbi:MAG: 50S ribosomal protein L9 [Nitrospiraceae bacterium]|nr:MAG: 50S ribosomal protein L9 [Nitrospiraceae bacterium]
MRIILREDVSTIGKIGDIIDVSDGYARNYLLPKKLAIEANKKNIREFEHYKNAMLRKAEKVKQASQSVADRLASTTLTIKATSGNDGKLFGAVTNIDIAEALKAEGFEIDRKKISLEEPIKRLGTHSVTVKLHPEISSQVSIEVIADSAE